MSPRSRFMPLLALLVIAAAPLNYALDVDASAVSAKVAFFGLASKTAGFPSMSGKVSIMPDRPSEALVDVTIDATRLTAPDKVTTERLRGEKFFWVEKYPTVHFVGHKLVMRDATHGSVDGKLTARGVTREEALFVTFDRSPVESARGEAITLSGEMQIDRRDYGMTAYRFIVGKEVTIKLKARMVPQN
ncbi:MAG: YceI family protein [Alphaproteobacteria bacterium]|nr:MAG: YceI family protein [Alphaproteobacteria bacterium]